jgi:hypothetical protein
MEEIIASVARDRRGVQNNVTRESPLNEEKMGSTGWQGYCVYLPLIYIYQ